MIDSVRLFRNSADGPSMRADGAGSLPLTNDRKLASVRRI
jgi:hypothetical protein